MLNFNCCLNFIKKFNYGNLLIKSILIIGLFFFIAFCFSNFWIFNKSISMIYIFSGIAFIFFIFKTNLNHPLLKFLISKKTMIGIFLIYFLTLSFTFYQATFMKNEFNNNKIININDVSYDYEFMVSTLNPRIIVDISHTNNIDYIYEVTKELFEKKAQVNLIFTFFDNNMNVNKFSENNKKDYKYIINYKNVDVIILMVMIYITFLFNYVILTKKFTISYYFPFLTFKNIINKIKIYYILLFFFFFFFSFSFFIINDLFPYTYNKLLINEKPKTNISIFSHLNTMFQNKNLIKD